MLATPATYADPPAQVVSVAYERASFADEPVTVLTVRDGSSTRVVRVLGGPNARGGVTYVGELGPSSVEWAPGSPAGTWPTSALPVPFFLALPKSRDLGDQTDAEVDVAARTWGRVACTAFRARYAGTTTTGPGDDGVSGVYFEDTAWPSTLPAGVIATTVVHVDAQGHIYDADVYVDGADNVFSLDGVSGVDFRSILTHELGHALGLGHSSDPRATMYASYPPGISWRSLEQDDRDGVCALYPGTGDALGCEATACPAGFTCVARDCERAGEQQEVCSPCEPLLHACEGSGDGARCVDLPSGAGRVCGRSCATDAECGQGFLCQPTTQAGDYQCVSQNGCASAADPCQKAADCKDPADAGWICGGGACLGPIADAGAEGGADASPDAGPTLTPSGGCSSAPGQARGGWALLLVSLVLLRRRAAPG
ncbi:MAG TPA: matrixin family metalloprotease [Polyangiaceae bacterium]|nr:matrixin family metalloprotease [Polyangiaceae bacterium]